jgi:hypothetical protein
LERLEALRTAAKMDMRGQPLMTGGLQLAVRIFAFLHIGNLGYFIVGPWQPGI